MHFIKFSINQHRINILFLKFKGPALWFIKEVKRVAISVKGGGGWWWLVAWFH